MRVNAKHARVMGKIDFVHIEGGSYYLYFRDKENSTIAKISINDSQSNRYLVDISKALRESPRNFDTHDFIHHNYGMVALSQKMNVEAYVGSKCCDFNMNISEIKAYLQETPLFISMTKDYILDMRGVKLEFSEQEFDSFIEKIDKILEN